jgi:hypothetical protein
MPTTTINYTIKTRNALADCDGYKATLEDGTPNPETVAQFVDRRIRETTRLKAREYLLAQARQAAEAAVSDDPIT